MLPSSELLWIVWAFFELFLISVGCYRHYYYLSTLCCAVLLSDPKDCLLLSGLALKLNLKRAVCGEDELRISFALSNFSETFSRIKKKLTYHHPAAALPRQTLFWGMMGLLSLEVFQNDGDAALRDVVMGMVVGLGTWVRERSFPTRMTLWTWHLLCLHLTKSPSISGTEGCLFPSLFSISF